MDNTSLIMWGFFLIQTRTYAKDAQTHTRISGLVRKGDVRVTI